MSKRMFGGLWPLLGVALLVSACASVNAQEAETLKAQADQAGMATGIFGVSEAAVKPYIEAGFTLVAVALDTMLIQEAARNILHVLKE